LWKKKIPGRILSAGTIHQFKSERRKRKKETGYKLSRILVGEGKGPGTL